MITVVWLFAVPDSVPAVPARLLNPELSCGSAPELMVLRASLTLVSVCCVVVLKSVESLVTLSTVVWVLPLRVFKSVRVPAAVLLASFNRVMICW